MRTDAKARRGQKRGVAGWLLMGMLVFHLAPQFFLPARADETEQRRREILFIIEEELREVGNISRQYRHRKPNLLLRIAELYLEKARLIRDEEQRKYLAIPPQKRAKISKKRAFATSAKYFTKAQKTCDGIIRNFRNFKLKADVYYVLAFNAKEFERKGEAKKYFSLARKNAKKKSTIYKKASLALAEIHYNENSYHRALSLYESGMRGVRDKWWTKDAYNMAWSYYRVRKFSRAIKLMKKIHRLSAEDNYIDMRKQVESSLGLFYVTANRFDEAVKFYRAQGKDISRQLVGLGKELIDRKQPIKAERVLVEAKKYTGKDGVTDVNLTLLTLLQNAGKYSKHFTIAKELVAIDESEELSDEQKELLIFQLKTVGGKLQSQAVSKAYRSNKKVRQKKAQLAGEYFELIAKIDRKQRERYLYLKAETFYGAGMMAEALKGYRVSFERAKRRRDKAQMKHSLEGMLAALAGKGLSQKMKKQYYIPVYRDFLSIDRRSKKAEKVHQKIFKQYFARKDFNNAEKIIELYQVNFPQNRTTQEAMVAKIMGHYQQTKNLNAFGRWVSKIKSGKYHVSKKYWQGMDKILSAMQLESVEKASQGGDKKSALKAALAIYRRSTTTPRAKKNAAHNITLLYLQLGYSDKTYLWADRTISMMGSKELLKFAESYLVISSELFKMQRFKKSALLSEKIYRKLCQEKFRGKFKGKEILYKNTYELYLASDRVTEANRVINSGEKCMVSVHSINVARLEMLKVLAASKKWKLFERYLKQLKQVATLRGEIIAPTALLRDAYLALSEQGRANQLEQAMMELYQKARSSGQSVKVADSWEIAKIKLRNMHALARKFNSIELAFPQKNFDALLGQKLKLLDRVSAQAESVFKVRSGKGALKAYQVLIESSQRLVQELREFVVPGKEAKYVASFKKIMKRQVITPLLKKSLDHLKEARRLIAGGQVLSPNSYWFLAQNRLPFNMEYHFSGRGVLMDKEGRR